MLYVPSPFTEGTEPLTGSSLDLDLLAGATIGTCLGQQLPWEFCSNLQQTFGIVLLSRTLSMVPLSHDVVCWKHICAFKLLKKGLSEQGEKKKKSTWQLPVCEQARRWGVAVTQLVRGAASRAPILHPQPFPTSPHLSMVLSALANFYSSFKTQLTHHLL